MTWRDLSVNVNTKISHEGLDFYGVRTLSALILHTKPMDIRRDPYWGSSVVTGRTPFRCPIEWTTDQSCAFYRFKPPLVVEEDAYPVEWIDYYLKGMEFKKPVSCYIQKDTGDVRRMLPVLVANGFNQVAQAKSNHGGYQVYMLVHPGERDPTKYRWSNYNYKKKDTTRDDDSTAVSEMD